MRRKDLELVMSMCESYIRNSRKSLSEAFLEDSIHGIEQAIANLKDVLVELKQRR